MKNTLIFFALAFVIFLMSCAIHEAVAFANNDKNHTTEEATVAEVETLVTATKLDGARLAFSNLTVLKAAFIDAAPTKIKDGITVGKLGVDGGNKAMLLKLAKEIADNKHGVFDSLLIAHKGKLLFESYYSRGRINLPHFQKSVTKIYVSLALGRAIELGYLTMTDLDKPLVSFLNDLDPSKFIEGAEKVTLHQALTMRSGIRINNEQRKELLSNLSQLKGQGHVQAYLENSAAITSESQRFFIKTIPC